MTRKERRDRSKQVRDKIFWISTGTGLIAAVALPSILKVLKWDPGFAISAFGSWTFFTVLGLYVGQRLLEIEFEQRHDDLAAAVNDNCATDNLKAILKEIRDNCPRSFHVIAQTSVKMLERQLKRASIGDLEIRDEDRLTVPLALATEVQTSLDTIAFFENDPTTGEYHDLLAEAISDSKRHITVRRLFLIKAGIENSSRFEERVRKDLNAKVQVRYRHIDKWIGSQGVPKPVDFGIWDQELVWIYTDDPEAKREEMHPKMVYGEVDLYQKAFGQNWDRATEPPANWRQPTSR